MNKLKFKYLDKELAREHAVSGSLSVENMMRETCHMLFIHKNDMISFVERNQGKIEVVYE